MVIILKYPHREDNIQAHVQCIKIIKLSKMHAMIILIFDYALSKRIETIIII